MEIGRTSCTSFWANQFRVLMTAAAYVLMQELRLRLARTDCARAQVSTLRERFLKLGVQVVASVRPYRAAFTSGIPVSRSLFIVWPWSLARKLAEFSRRRPQEDFCSSSP